jgi:3-(methylthio)propanoyl-CoA dehydrogenase
MYRAPLREMRFLLQELLGSGRLGGTEGLPDYSDDLAQAVLEEAARFAETVLEPLNRPGDLAGVRWTEEGVRTAPGFVEAYQQFVAGGWPALGGAARFGGQAAPRVLVTAVGEFWGSANLAFKLCPMLTQGAAHALELCGTPAQKERFLGPLVSGEWTGTMVLTEPQAGSDLGQVRTRAVPEGDHYRLFGQKIFITWGDHDLTPNTLHLLLARIDGAPPGVRGISLFLAPKRLVNADGSLGERNDVRCLSVEEKLGIHASPTCVLAFGERAGALAHLIGEPGRGLEYMFIMMNSARLSVASEGYAVGERAFQRAADWARTRVQGKPPVASTGAPLPIIHHPDVKRMLLLMKSQTEASRALTLYTALQFDLAEHGPEAQRAAAQARGELLTPIIKGWCTELGNEVASLGVQVHGGMGFIEETGAAQYMRDVRITTIYEGTTGIQANDLIGRKVGRDRGAAMSALIEEMSAELAQPLADPQAESARRAAAEAVQALAAATQALLAMLAQRPELAMAVSVPYLKLCGYTGGGWLLARSAALAAGRDADADREFYRAKLHTAAFYAAHVLPLSAALSRIVQAGGGSVTGTDAALV